MKKPSVYLDTSVISSYWYESPDIVAVARRLVTRQWWATERPDFVVFASEATENELAEGDFRHQKKCLGMCRALRYKAITKPVHDLARRLLSLGVVPANKFGDAMQMAVAAVHEIDYLLTWNYAHLANPVAQARLAEVCANLKLQIPWMVTPESIPKSRLGQPIRRPR